MIKSIKVLRPNGPGRPVAVVTYFGEAGISLTCEENLYTEEQYLAKLEEAKRQWLIRGHEQKWGPQP